MSPYIPIPRSFAPSLRGAPVTVTSQGGSSLAHLAVTLLARHNDLNRWDQPAAIYGLLDPSSDAALSAEAKAIRDASAPDESGMMAVLLPGVNETGDPTAYHTLACLDLSQWAGAACVVEAWITLPDGRRKECRTVMALSANGELTSAAQVRNRRLPKLVDCYDSPAGGVADFLRAALGLPNANFPSAAEIDIWLHAALGPTPGDEFSALTDDSISDDEAVRSCVRLLANPTTRRAALDLSAPKQQTTLGQMFKLLASPRLDISVTPELRAWLGDDYFYEGCHHRWGSSGHAADCSATLLEMRAALKDHDDADAVRVRANLCKWVTSVVTDLDLDVEDHVRLLAEPVDSPLYRFVTLTSVCGDGDVFKALKYLYRNSPESQRVAREAAKSITMLRQRCDVRRSGIAESNRTIQRVHRVLTDLSDPLAVAAHLA